MSSFYVTCAIDYPNNVPHLGTAYEKIAADVLARYHRLVGDDVFFLMGNDEHSQNVRARALREGMDPLEYCDRMEGVFRDVWERLHVSYDGFIRTTEPRHRRTVEALLERMEAAGDFYAGTYEGFYCVGCEAYYVERDLDDGRCPQHGTEPEWREEDNTFFRLSKYEASLRRHIEANPGFIRPQVRRNEILALLDRGLDDVSVSRAAEVGWGIPMPGRPGQVVYVWFDALINYITAAGFPDDEERFARWWPADLHMIGKDITRFHCVIWPAMLMSAGLPLPRVVFGHGFVTVAGGRMSKSVGNVMDPVEVSEIVGVDPLRYFLMREVTFGRDLDFELDRLVERYNSDLANDLGNLLRRTLSMASKYRGTEVPAVPVGDSCTELPGLAAGVRRRYRAAFEELEIQAALQAAWELVSAANLAIDRHKPWELAKDEGSGARLDRVLVELVDALRQTAVLLYPVMPGKAAEMARQLGVESEPGDWRLEEMLDPAARPRMIAPGDPLFPRHEIEAE